MLDPACGSGNFLYVALEMMKRLEGEVTALLDELGDKQTLLITIDPHQFLGLELNPWAANVAELVLWIGYLQWHFRTFGKATPSQPVLKDFKNIRQGDAVLTWGKRTPRLAEDGTPVTRWDGVTTVTHQVTGEEVPDPSARIQVYDYSTPKPTKWPEAEFIVGNPPFIGKLKMREDLGDGYVEALRKAYPQVPDSADFVMYWWYKSAQAVQNRKTPTRRFGLITTRAAKQTFNARIIQAFTVDAKAPVSLLFAIPDHPWIDTVLAAKVRIAMTVGAAGRRSGVLKTVAAQDKLDGPEEGWRVELASAVGTIRPNLRLGADVLSARELQSNRDLCSMGFATGSRGFLLSASEYAEVPLAGRQLLRRFISANEITKLRKDRYVIDAWIVESERELLVNHPWVYQWLREKVFRRDLKTMIRSCAESGGGSVVPIESIGL